MSINVIKNFKVFVRKYFVFLILTCILLFHGAHNLLWLRISNFPIGYDTYWHLLNTFIVHISFQNALQSHLSFWDIVRQLYDTAQLSGWPPFVYFLSSLFYLNHFNLFAARFYVNFLFYIMLVVSVFFLGKKYFSRDVGLCAAFLISFYPSIYGLSRQFELDFPLTAIIALSLCLLLYSENFTHMSYSLLFGVSLGVASLIKLQMCFFMGFPLVYCIWRVIKSNRDLKVKSYLNIFLSLSISFLFFSLFWIGKWDCMIHYNVPTFFQSYPFYEGWLDSAFVSIPIFTFECFIYYFIKLAIHVSLPLFILFITAFIQFIFLREKNRLLIVAGFIIPLLIFTFISAKHGKYILPILIYNALITAWSINNLGGKYIARIIKVSLLCYCLGLHYYSSWIQPYYFFPFLKYEVFAIERPNLYPPNIDQNSLKAMPQFDYPGAPELNLDNIRMFQTAIQDMLMKKERVYIECIGIKNDGSQYMKLCLYLYSYFKYEFFSKRLIITFLQYVARHTADFLIINTSVWEERKEILYNYKEFLYLDGYNDYVVLQNKD